MTDSAIAEKMGISSQAVGKIRHKLETSVIKSYSMNLDYSRMGVQVFALAISKLTPAGMDTGELEVERILQQEPSIIQVYRIPSGNATHVILYAFKDMEEMDAFFHSTKKRAEIHRFMENRDLFTFSHNSMLKNDPSLLFCKMIEGIESEKGRFVLEELENFKRRLG